MGSADLTDKSEASPLQVSGVQPLVRRLQISPPADFCIRSSNLFSQKSSPQYNKTNNSISQYHVAANFKNTPISRRLGVLSRPVQAIPNAQHRYAATGLQDNAGVNYGSRPGSEECLAEDLVNLLVRPDAPLETETLSWFMMPLLPLHVIGGWIKHILWLSMRVFPWKYPVVSPDKVIASEAVQIAINKTCEREAIRDLANAEVVSKDCRSRQIQRAREILNGIAASTSGPILRIAAVVVNRLFLSCLSGVHVRRDHLANLRSLSLANPDIPVIYLPLHRSHLDYILLTYTLWLQDIRLPQVAAGDNIALPLFNSILRGLGAFFIRRRIDQDSNARRQLKDKREPFSKDYVYRGVLQEYVCELLAMGHSLEFYMEGGRSRSGRTLPAKAGLLSILVHAYQLKLVKNVIIVPGAVTYDKLFDGNFVEEQRGLPKMKETFGGALRSIFGVMCSKFGAVRIEFGKPFTLETFLRENVQLFNLEQDFDLSDRELDIGPSKGISKVRTCSSASLVNAMPENQQQINKLTQCLATRILCASTSAQAISGPSLVAFLMMTQYRSGCHESQLMSSLVELCDLLTTPPNNRSIMINQANRNEIRRIFKYSKWLFPNLFEFRSPSELSEDEDAFSSTTSIDDFGGGRTFYARTDQLNATLELQYLANPVVEALVGEAILATALLTARAEPAEPVFVDDKGKTSELVVRGSFYDVPPATDVCPVNWTSVEQIVAELCDILELEFVYLQEPRETVQTLENAKYILVKEGLLIAGAATNMPSIRSDARAIRQLTMMKATTAHLIEGYYIVARQLKDLRKDSVRFCDRCLAGDFLRKALAKCEKGHIDYPEGCSKDIIQNAVKLFVRWGVLVPSSRPQGIPRNVGVRAPRPSGHFYVGEQSNVESADSNSSSSSTESLDFDLCSASKCLSASAGVAPTRYKISNEWLDHLDELVLKFQRFRTPAANE